MSESAGTQQEGERVPAVPDAAALAAQTREVAAQVSEVVGHAYLNYRRAFYHESDPSLATVPPSSPDVQQTDAARIAQRALKLMPREAHAVPLVRELMDHLQWVVDIHTLTDDERVQLHNMTMVFLHGMTDGIQAWYVNWLLAAAHTLRHVTHPNYYLAFPWQGLLYRGPEELAVFDEAVRTGNVGEIEREITRLSSDLAAVLRDPLGTQPRLAFAGPNGERRKMIFDLKTSAALALGAYLGVELLRAIVTGQRPAQSLRSAISLPAEIAPHLVPDDATRGATPPAPPSPPIPPIPPAHA